MFAEDLSALKELVIPDANAAPSSGNPPIGAGFGVQPFPAPSMSPVGSPTPSHSPVPSTPTPPVGSLMQNPTHLLAEGLSSLKELVIPDANAAPSSGNPPLACQQAAAKLPGGWWYPSIWQPPTDNFTPQQLATVYPVVLVNLGGIVPPVFAVDMAGTGFQWAEVTPTSSWAFGCPNEFPCQSPAPVSGETLGQITAKQSVLVNVCTVGPTPGTTPPPSPSPSPSPTPTPLNCPAPSPTPTPTATRPPAPPYAPQDIEDNRTRDLFVGAAQLPVTDYDQYTGMFKGELTIPESPPPTISPGTLSVLGPAFSPIPESPPPSPGLAPAPVCSPYDELCFDSTGKLTNGTGTVLGVKYPQVDASGNPMAIGMPMRDTPLFDTTPTAVANDPDIAFLLGYLQMDNWPFYKLSDLTTTGGTRNVYGVSPNLYQETTWPLGGPVAGCANVLAPGADLPSSIPDIAYYTRAEIDYCVARYILNASIAPWYEMARPGNPKAYDFGTSDPLSKNDPVYSIINSCYPLGSGTLAKTALLGTPTRAMATGSPVWRYTGTRINSLYNVDLYDATILAAAYDEDEYAASTYYSKAWNTYFQCGPNQGMPCTSQLYPGLTLTQPVENPFGNPTEIYCVYESPPIDVVEPSPSPASSPGVSPSTSPSPLPTYPPPPESIPPQCETPPPTCPPTPSPEPGPEACGAPIPQPPPDYMYQATPRYSTLKDKKGNLFPQWCPNVQEIRDPLPFSARLDIYQYQPQGTTDPTPKGTSTDRDIYSPQTEVLLHCPLNCATHMGYTTYNTDVASSGYSKTPWAKADEFPVEMAIVPVDVLNVRQAAFDSCIRQRIAYNQIAYINLWQANGCGQAPDPADEAHMAQYGPGGGVGPPYTTATPEYFPGTTMFRPPCATHPWEQDSLSGCPARLSIQECAHILIKDVVPVNYLETRTCEGLRDNRINNASVSEGGGNVANILDMDYAGNPGEQGPDVYIDEGNFQKALAATEQLNQYTCQSSNPKDANADGSSEPPEYAFRNYVRFAYYDAAGNYVDDYLRPNDKTKFPLPQGTKLIGANMPYDRWVDTGTSAGQPLHGGSFLNTLGSWDAIVGLGRPERSQGDVTLLAANPPQGPEEQASGASPVVDTNYNIKAPAEQSRVGGWLELVEEQALVSERRYDLACLTRPEKVLKPGAALDSVLTLLGGQYITQGNPAQGVPPQTFPWPDHFPGYESDTHGHAIPVNFTGLDKAQPGDIVTYTLGADNGAPGLPIVAAVIAVDFSDPNYPNITVEHWDSPRLALPTGGGTLDFGQPVRQTIYHYDVPAPYQKFIASHTLFAYTPDAKGTAEPSCMDWQYSACVLPMNTDAQGNAIDPWTTATIYRPSLTANIIGCASPNGYPNIAGYTEPMSRQLQTSLLADFNNLGCDSPLTWRSDNGQGTYNGPGSADSALTTLILTKPSFFGGSLSSDPTEQFFPTGPKDVGP